MATETWTPTVGEEVAVLSGGWRQMIVTTDTVAKVGKRDIVLSKGRRFNATTGYESGRPYGDQIVSANDPAVLRIRAAREQRDRKDNVMRLVEVFRREPTPENASTLAEAAQTFARDYDEDAL